MAHVSVLYFKRVEDALRALSEAEYRAFLHEAGCPADKVEGEVRKMLEYISTASN